MRIVWNEVLRLVFHIVNVLSLLMPDDAVSRRLRPLLWRRLGLTIGRNVRMLGGSHILGPSIAIGNNAFIARSCYFDATAPIAIGADVVIGHGSTLITAEHTIGPARRRCSPSIRGRPIHIGRGAWIGANSTILPGVTIEAGAVVAAGSVVTKDVAANAVVGGAPAVVLRALD